jgi:hypothetical protein
MMKEGKGFIKIDGLPGTSSRRISPAAKSNYLSILDTPKFCPRALAFPVGVRF